jgi:hypothetical protein
VSLNEDGGVRVSTAVAYLFPLSELPDNLTVMCDTKALKVVVDKAKPSGSQRRMASCVPSGKSSSVRALSIRRSC